MQRHPRTARLLFAASLLLCTAALANDAGGTISLSLPDVVLRDQNGDRVRVPELIRDRVVVMNFVFTSCTTICSPMGANFGELQTHVGAGVRLISVSIDPTADTPARLKKWSKQFHAGPSWTLLTGDGADVERLLKALGVYTPNRFAHAPILLVGDGTTGRWLRANGLAAPDDVVAMIRRVHAPGETSSERTRR
jgi:protein SCO1/2